MINPTIWNKKFILAFALISILLILFIFPFIQARVLIDELQTDLSFRSGLEVETEYYGAGGVAPLQENFYYYEFHPITSLDRANINPVCSCDVVAKGGWCPPGHATYKESDTYCPETDSTGLNLDDLEYRRKFADQNPLYWKAYAVGQGRYGDIDYSLATYLSSKGVASVSHESGGPIKTFSKIFYYDDGRVVGEIDYGKISSESVDYETHLEENKYRGFDSTTSTMASTREGTLSVIDGADASGSPRVVAIDYAPDTKMIEGSFDAVWGFKIPSRVKAWNVDALQDGDWDIDVASTDPRNDQYKKRALRVDESYRYDKFLSPSNPFAFNGNYVSSVATVTRDDESDFQSCGVPMHENFGFTCPINKNANSRCSVGKPTSTHSYDYDDKVSWNTDTRTVVWDDAYFDYDRCGNLIKTVNIGTYRDRQNDLKSDLFYTNVSYDISNKAFPTRIDYYGNSESNPPLTKRATYHSYGLVDTTIDENNRVTDYDYDVLGRISQIVSPDGGQVNYYYTTPSGAMWTVKVVQKQTNSVNVETCNIYDYGGRLAQVQLKDLDRNRIIFSTTTYDSLGRANKQYKPGSVAGTGSFCTYQSPSSLYTETQYDSLGRTKRIIYPDGNYSQFSYGSNYKTVTDARLNSHTYYYDGFGILERVVDSAGTQFNVIYDDFYGNVERVDVFGASVSSLSSSVYINTPYQNGNPSLPIRVSSLEEGETSFRYDSSGNIIRSIDSEGIIKDVDYDKYSRISKTTAYKANDADTKEEITFYYGGDSNCESNLPSVNNANRVCKIVGNSSKDGDQTFYVEESYEYDEVGRVTKRTQDINNEKLYTLTYDYDLAGNLIHLTYPDGKIINYNYNSLNQMEGVSYTNPQGQTTEAIYTYNPTGTLEERQLTSAGIVKFYTTYSYNSMDFLTSIFASEVKNLRTGDVYFERTYAFDKIGNINKIAYSVDLSNNGNNRGNMPPSLNYESFTYDNLNRLTSANYYGNNQLNRGISYGYDALGNRQTETSTNPSYIKNYGYEDNKLKSISGGI